MGRGERSVGRKTDVWRNRVIVFRKHDTSFDATDSCINIVTCSDYVCGEGRLSPAYP